MVASNKAINKIDTITIAIPTLGCLTSSWWPQKKSPQGMLLLADTSSNILLKMSDLTAMT